MFSLTSLKCFAAAAEELNFTRAAKRLFISQQALSSHISKLEEYYGVRLFDRGIPMTLTDAGRALQKHAREILSSVDDYAREVQDIKNFRQGELTVGIPVTRGTIMLPPVVENVSIEWERQGQPGKLTAEVVKTPGLSFQEGDPCRFSVDGTPVFYGFVFEKSRKGNNPNVIKCVVYDQLYYLKNKDTYVYTNKTASEVIKMVAEDFQLNVGELEDTGYKIASRVEDNQTLFDIIQNALDETLKATGQMYVLYDNVGKLTLKSLGNMKLNMLVDEDTAGDYDYKSSIATQTYDKIKLSYENKETGKREIYIAQDGSHINQWGVLQYYEKLDSKANAKAMADALLDLYNTKTRTLKLQDVLGDIRVRAGTLLVVMLGLGDINVSNYLMAEQVKHTFNDGQHLMELKMRGGTFVA